MVTLSQQHRTLLRALAEALLLAVLVPLVQLAEVELKPGLHLMLYAVIALAFLAAYRPQLPIGVPIDR